MKKKIQSEKIKDFCERVFGKIGLNHEDSKLVTDVLVESDLRGITSHGINRFNRYIKAIKKGDINILSCPKIISQEGATTIIDGNHCLGQKAGYIGMQETIRIAKKYGVAITTVKNSNHYGIAGYYSMMALKEDMIGISMTNTAPLVVPTFGKEAVLGTNPISVAVPTGIEYPWVMDFATSIVPRGKIEVAAKLGKKLKSGWAVDSDGNNCLDPHAVLNSLETVRLGGILPMGTYKGYGFATLVDILCGVLSGSEFGKGVYSKGEPKVGHFFMAIDITKFMNIEEFKIRMNLLMGMLHGSHKNNSKVFVHGEKEYLEHKKRSSEGIPFDREFLDILDGIGEEHGVNTSW
ncbi:MAG: Ldh family oxidoreductase [Candidatus Gracilibacteria bacterium]|nr:Ldh family oxidoreductase [Candidatus Gracilibacteria bacterium]